MSGVVNHDVKLGKMLINLVLISFKEIINQCSLVSINWGILSGPVKIDQIIENGVASEGVSVVLSI